jgi:teichuronic acid exporter
MRTGVGFSLARYANFVAKKGDYFVVGRWLGAAPLGLYERAYVLMDLSNSLLTNSLNTILFPAFSKLQDDSRALAAAFERVSGILALIFLPAGIACSLLAPEIIGVLLGPNWEEAVAPFQVLALAMFFRTAMKMSSVLLIGAGAAYRNAWSQTIYAFLVVGGALVMVRYGITGVAFAVLAALVITYLMATWQALRLVDMGWRRLAAAYLPSLWIAPIVAGTILAVALPMRGGGASPLLILLAAGGTILVLLAAILFALPQLFGPHARWLLQQLPIKLLRR